MAIICQVIFLFLFKQVNSIIGWLDRVKALSLRFGELNQLSPFKESIYNNKYVITALK